MIMGEEIPGVTILAVVLAHGAPLALAQVRSPHFPRSLLFPHLAKSNVFCGHDAPEFISEGKSQSVLAVSRHGFKICLGNSGERPVMVPRHFHRRKNPEVAFRILRNSLPTRPAHEEGRRLLSYGGQVSLLRCVVVSANVPAPLRKFAESAEAVGFGRSP